MMKKWKYPYPTEPAASWNGAPPEELDSEPIDSIDENAALPAYVDDGDLYSDDDFYKDYILVVRIMFVQFTSADGFSGWYWFSSGRTLDTCATSPDTIVSGDSATTFANPGFPGSNDGNGVIEDTEAYGYENCVYSFDASNPGSIKCDDLDAFPCVVDDGAVVDCPGGGASQLDARQYKPRVKCEFPRGNPE